MIFTQNISKKSIEKILKQSTIEKRNKIGPPLSLTNRIYKNILNFIRNKKRKIYGGYAQSALVEEKSKKSGFYNEYDLYDIEFYSPYPIQDIIELSNLLDFHKVACVKAKTAIHEETFVIFALTEYINFVNVTYCPLNIYKSIPTIQVDGIHMVHPMFMYIDFFRIFSNTINFSFRLEKTIDRFNIITKYYPIQFLESGLVSMYKKDEKLIDMKDIKKKVLQKKSKTDSKDRKCILKIIQKYDPIFLGDVAFNYFVEEFNKISKTKEEKLPIHYFELIHTKYKTYTQEMIKLLKKAFPKRKIVIEEYYPYFQFTGRSVRIYIDNILYIIVYGNNNLCIPYVSSKKHRISCFDYTMMFELTSYFYNKTFILSPTKHIYKIKKLLEMHQRYFEVKKDLTYTDPSPFQHFILRCDGLFYDPKTMKQKELQKKNFKIFEYIPSRDKKSRKILKEKFKNSSGSIIKIDKQLLFKV